MIDTKKIEYQLKTLYNVLQFGINREGRVMSYDVVYAIRQSIMNIVMELDEELDKMDKERKQE